VPSFKRQQRRLSLVGIFAALAMVLTACGAAKPLEYTGVGEIPPGPGLFTGKDGNVTIFRK